MFRTKLPRSAMVYGLYLCRLLQQSRLCFSSGDSKHYRKIEGFKVQHTVHTLAVDLEAHRVYTPEQEENGKPVGRMVVYEAVTVH